MKKIIQAGFPVVMTIFLVFIIELGLRLVRYGNPPEFFIKQKADGKVEYINNIFYTEKFFAPGLIRTPVPIRIAEEKSDNTIRIAIAGESAAVGDPDYSFGFARILKIMLEESHPLINFEIINTAVTAVNSNVILPVVKETQKKIKPDIWLIYMGNNEVIGPYGPNNRLFRIFSGRRFIKFNIAMNSTRIGMLARNINFRLFGKNLYDEWGGMEMFLDYKAIPGDRHTAMVNDIFRENLIEMCREVSDNAKIIVSTVAVNLRDCPPFLSVNQGSLPDSLKFIFDNYFHEAIALYDSGFINQSKVNLEAALEIDYHHAGSHFLLGEINYKLGKYDPALHHYNLALDNDALKFRANNDLNGVVRDVNDYFSDNQNVSLLDFRSLLEDSVSYSIPGSEIFLEHVHFNFTGNYLLASHFKKKIEEEMNLKPDIPGIKSVDYYKERLAYTPFESFRLHRDILNRLDKNPFAGRIYNNREKEKISFHISEIKKNIPREKEYLKAMENSPGDWMIKYNYVLFLMGQGIYSETALELLHVIKHAVPQNATVEFNIGYWYENRKNYVKALEHYQKALEIYPYYTEARKNAAVLMLSGRHAGAGGFIRGSRFDDFTLSTIYLKAGNLAISSNHIDYAIELLESAHLLNPLDHKFVRLLTDLYFNKKDFRKFISLLEKKSYDMILSADDYIKLGIAYEETGNYQNALENFLKSLQIEPADFRSLNKAGLMNYTLGNYFEAIKYYELSATANPLQRLEFAYTNIGLAYSKLDEPDRAIEYYQKAIELAQEHREILALMAREYEKTGKIDHYEQIKAQTEGY
jgi:tetratricopeptide (TPR) repeat protein